MILFGHRYSDGGAEGLEPDELLRHLYVLGKTGSGKSTALSRIHAEWMATGRGGCLVDPHGDLVGEILRRVPRERTRDVVIIDPSDRDHPVAWNPLFHVPPHRRPVVAQGLVAAFRGVWSDSWGPRMEYILLNSLRLLLDAGEESLLGLPRLLVDRPYRRHLERQCTDPVVRGFWRDEFDVWDNRFRKEAISPIQNKLGQFLGDPRIRSMIGQRRSRLDLRRSMDSGKLIFLNLSKGLIGEGSANLLGSLFVASIHEAALSRADVEEDRRSPFLLSIDEFQNVTTERMASALSEVRKYGVGLVLCHQYLDQLSHELRSAVLGNTGSMLLFRLGGHDANLFSKEFGADWPASRFAELSAYRAVFLVGTRKGLPVPQVISTLPGSERIRSEAGVSRMIRYSQERFGRDGAEVEAAIERWFSRKFSAGSGQKPATRGKV